MLKGPEIFRASEWARDLQSLGYLAGYLLDPAGGLHVQLLRRELNGRIARVYARELDVLRDGVGYDGTVVPECTPANSMCSEMA